MIFQKMSYKQLERYLSIAVIAEAVMFVVFLFSAGAGTTWLKIFMGILCVIISAACLAVLYIRKELLRPRSLWVTLASGAILILLLFSLVLNYPSPKPVAVGSQVAAASTSQAE